MLTGFACHAILRVSINARTDQARYPIQLRVGEEQQTGVLRTTMRQEERELYMSLEDELENWYVVDGKVYTCRTDPVLDRSTLLCVVRVSEGYVSQVRALSKNELFRVGTKILRMVVNG